MILPETSPIAIDMARLGKGIDGAVGESDEAAIKKSALQFEGILVRQLLQPMEKILTGGMGGEGASPMVGGMIISGLAQSIIEGGGLGLAAVIEEALRDPPVQQVSSREGLLTEVKEKSSPVKETAFRS